MTLATQQKTNLLGLTKPQMEAFFESIGEKRFRAGQVMKWKIGRASCRERV